MELLLEINGLHTEGDSQYPKLQSFYFDLLPNEVHAIVGEYGSGQVTLIKVLAGLYPAMQGRFIINGNRVELNSVKNSKRNGISIVHDDYLHLDLSVEENIFLGKFPSRSWIQKIQWKQLRSLTTNLLRELEVSINPSALVSELPPDQQRFVALGKALANKPLILILNDPTSGLKEAQVPKLFQLIRRCAINGIGVIYISRRIEEVLQIADRVSVLKDGSIRQTLSIQEAKSDIAQVFRIMMGSHKSDTRGFPQETRSLIDTWQKTNELLASEYELHDVLNFLTNKAQTLMSADSCSIQIVDEETGSVMHRRKHNGGAFKVSLKKEIVQAIIQQSKPLIVSNLSTEECGSKYLSEPTNEVKAFLCMPVKVRSRVAGVVQVFYRTSRQFRYDEVEMLATFANQAAVAIENTRLLGRSALLQEAHHRIKNNLQSMISLLSLQLEFSQFKTVESVVSDSICRIKNIAAVHDLLSKDEKGIGMVNAKKIIESIISSTNITNEVEFSLFLEDVMVSYKQASSLALVVGELIANSIKHGFQRQTGKLLVTLNVVNQEIVLTVADNGRGLPTGFTMEANSNLGLTIVRTLIRNDLHGSFSLSSDTSGTLADIKIPWDPYQGG